MESEILGASVLIQNKKLNMQHFMNFIYFGLILLFLKTFKRKLRFLVYSQRMKCLEYPTVLFLRTIFLIRTRTWV